MKVLLILPYFGKLPNYFTLYLETIKRNGTIQWLLITDDETNYDYPENITVVYKKFTEVKQLFQDKFPFPIALESSQKLCDFRPAFGLVFEAYCKGYDYWGHCDSDILWGNFNHFLNWELLATYDKIFTFGHLTLYRNSAENNSRFLLPLENNERYKTVFSHQFGFAFDEKFNKSINSIYAAHQVPVFAQSFMADIDPYHSNMRLSLFDYQTHTYSTEPFKRQIFTWESGEVFRYYIANHQLVKEAFLYIHLQKRAMQFDFDPTQVSKVLITSDAFLPLDEAITPESFKKYYIRKWLNRQFFRVKWKSLNYKLKYKEYFYGSKKNL